MIYYDLFVKDCNDGDVVQIGSLLTYSEVRSLVLVLNKSDGCDFEIFWKDVKSL